MIVNASEYKPEFKGESDKFSWNIYKTLKKWEGSDVRVYRFGWNSAYGRCSLDAGEIRMGFGGFPFECSANLIRITVDGPNSIGCCVSFSGEPPSSYEQDDITDSFFREYKRIGRCLFQPQWSHDWISINRNSRKCKHCGEHQKRSVIKSVMVTRDEVWK